MVREWDKSEKKKKNCCTSLELSEQKPKSRVKFFPEQKHIEEGTKIEDLVFCTITEC